MEQLLSVQEASATVRSTLITSSWQFHISWSDSISSFQYPDHEGQLERFRWLLESHAISDPLDVAKASQIREELNQYCDTLSTSLPDVPASSRPCFLDIYDCSEESSCHSIPWELLENSAWGQRRPLIIRRRVNNAADVTSSEVSTPETFNMLFLAARRQGDDEDYRQAALPILRVIQDLPDGAPHVTIHMVRPGTYQALRECLARAVCRQDGFCYQLVHLDVHGGLNKKNEANLSFSDRVISASKVARLLRTHGVQFAVLNACESARGDKGLKGNLAKTFVRENMAAVLAMSYKLNISAVSLATHSFYDGLFRRNFSFTRAVSVTRQAMREYPERKGRFGLRVNLQDWIVPVVYSSIDSDPVMAATARVSKIQRNLPLLFGRADTSKPLPTVLAGRDADILRIEEKLLHNVRTGKGGLLLLDGSMGIGKTTLLQHLQWWWSSTGMIVNPIYVNLKEFRGQSPEAACNYILQQLDNGRQFKAGNAIKCLQTLLAGMTEESNDDPGHLYPRPLLIFDHLWGSDWHLFGKRAKPPPVSHWASWKSFFQNLSESPAFIIVASYKWPWYLDDHESSEFAPETIYGLGPLGLNRMDITMKTGGDHILAGLLQTSRNIDHLDLILEWCGRDPGLLDIILPLVRDIGVEKASEILITGKDIFCLPQLHAGDLKHLPTYKVAKNLWKNAFSSFKELIIAFSPFLTYLPRCYESYCQDFVGNKHALLHPFRDYLAKFYPEAAMYQSTRVLSVKLLAASKVMRILLPQLKSMGLIQAKHMLGPSKMQSGLTVTHERHPLEGTKLYEIHPVFSLFLRHKARKAGFLSSSQNRQQSWKSICLEKTFVDYHEKRVFEWAEQHSPDGMAISWDAKKELEMCKSSFVAAMEIKLRSPRERFVNVAPTPAFLFWCQTPSGHRALVRQPLSMEYIATCYERTLSNCRTELSMSWWCLPSKVKLYADLLEEAGQACLWLATYNLLFGNQRDKFVLYVGMAEEILSKYPLRNRSEYSELNSTISPEIASMEAKLDVFKCLRDDPNCSELMVLAKLPFVQIDGADSSNGWNVIRRSLTITDRFLRLDTKVSAMEFWNAGELSQSLNDLRNEADNLLTELAPIWPGFLSTLDSEMLCRMRLLGFREEDDLVMIPDGSYDEVVSNFRKDRHEPIPNYASIFMAAIQKGTSAGQALSDFHKLWEYWINSNSRPCILQFFQLSLNLESGTHKAIMEAAQISLLKVLGDWPLALEHLEILVIRERMLPLQNLSESQLGRVVWWHLTAGFFALRMSSWDCCLTHITAVFDIVSQRSEVQSRQHFYALMLLVRLQMTAPCSLRYSISTAEALYRALALGYAKARESIYACNGAILSILLRLGASERSSVVHGLSEDPNLRICAGISIEVCAELEYILSSTLAPDATKNADEQNFNKQADAIKDLQSNQTTFPHSIAFCSCLLRLFKGQPAEARTIITNAENHLFSHARGCGCQFDECSVTAATSNEDLEELGSFLPMYDLEFCFNSSVSPHRQSMHVLSHLWFAIRFRDLFCESPLDDERTEDILGYLGEWHREAR